MYLSLYYRADASLELELADILIRMLAGIGAMSADNGQLSTGIYNLAGCKVKDTDNLKGGVYIVNGRNGIW